MSHGKVAAHLDHGVDEATGYWPVSCSEPAVEVGRIAGCRADEAQRRLEVKANNIRVGRRHYGCGVAACKRVIPSGEEVTNVRFIGCHGFSFPFVRHLQLCVAPAA
jgi:hypothetical protein